jgi:hypothetical protein
MDDLVGDAHVIILPQGGKAGADATAGHEEK